MSTIALKITSLLVRTLAKPIANTIKGRAKHHGPFRKVCITVAQTLHSTDVRLRLGLLGDASKAKVRPLNDAKAIDMGANFLSESFLFAIAAGAIMVESVRSSRKSSARQENVEDNISELQEEVSKLKAIIAKLPTEQGKNLGLIDVQATGSSSVDMRSVSGENEDAKNNVVIISSRKPTRQLSTPRCEDLEASKESAGITVAEKKMDITGGLFAGILSLYR
ncbi:optic atrophy 3 protein-domain-containing protein [Lipomyces tetrasporus]|uniref:Optic atrophy 3 protein-domain-containing protein n=1 Tax=Lipomyces tetrasporus TaxID=54092 RepID=A0AAD7QLF3_9ASCO|nr:optic atrophy 3 protein-domain-containing protein [Lipomyces tetrasporus]KAJ8097304.1 optic atrophy 3 protein-domain-containing protein [Lipomyces tetrasporus]